MPTPGDWQAAKARKVAPAAAKAAASAASVTARSAAAEPSTGAGRVGSQAYTADAPRRFTTAAYAAPPTASRTHRRAPAVGTSCTTRIVGLPPPPAAATAGGRSSMTGDDTSVDAPSQ